MAQRFVLKDRSKDADGKKERSHMIRDPRQKARDDNSAILRKLGPNNKNVTANQKGKIISLDEAKRKKLSSQLPPNNTKSSKTSKNKPVGELASLSGSSLSIKSGNKSKSKTMSSLASLSKNRLSRKSEGKSEDGFFNKS